jgi:FdhD protein
VAQVVVHTFRRCDLTPTAKRADSVVVEEPLEQRLDGDTLAITMRTPGHDRELCAGLLLAEGIIASASDLGALHHCRDHAEDGLNVVEARAAPGVILQAPGDGEDRQPYLRSSSCGLCGRAQVDHLLSRAAPLAARFTLPRAFIHDKTRELREEQPNFSTTGGAHAAGIVDQGGRWLAVREDVGRHNAVDKVVGRLLLDGVIPHQQAAPHALFVSGRVSFEIVQKAWMARIPFIVGVSAPSSLAVDTANRGGITLVAFSRDDSFNVYSHEQRLA